MAPGHVGLGPGLVDEDQAFGVEPALMFLPALAPAGDVGAVLFAGVQALFLNVMPSRAKNAQSAPWLTLIPSAASSARIARNLRSGFCAIRASSQSRLLVRRCGRRPPIARAAALPVTRKRCDHLTTVATLTLNIFAAARHEQPPDTDATTRSRKSCE
jgi:hypothetical protein